MTFQVPQLELDPPGSIGLSKIGALVLLRFDEATDDVQPSDACGALDDLHIDGVLTTLPAVESGFTGWARVFVAGDSTGLIADDIDSGASLSTRDVSIAAIVRWDFDDQVLAAQNACIIARGKNTNAANYVAYGLELVVVNGPARTAQVRMFWQDIAGVLHTCTGADFKLTRASEWMIITATRRWVSSSEVVCRYYIGSQLVGEFTETEGDIGGGTTGSTTIGGRRDNATWGSFLCGALDELQVVKGVLSSEEIEATCERILRWQPMGEQLVVDCHPPGFPLDLSPATRVGRETRLMGHGLGYSASLAENMRRNLMPDRAYGAVLARWERMTKQSPRLGDSIERRRARVVGHFRRLGVSPPGVRKTLRELLGYDDEDDIGVLAFSNTITDDFASLLARRWRQSDSGTFSAAGSLVIAGANGDPFLYDGASKDWATLLTGYDGPKHMIGGYGAEMFCKLTPTTLPDLAETGLVFYDWIRNDALMFGVRRDGADYKVVTQRVLAGAQQAVAVHATTSLTPHWLHVRQDEPELWNGTDAFDSLKDHTLRGSTTSAIAGFSEQDSIQFSLACGWVGMYARTWSGPTLGGNLSVNFDDLVMRFPHGRRPFYFYAFRDPGDPGSYDLAGANAVLRRLKHSHTHAAAISSLDVLCGEAESGCGLGPCGGF